MPGDAPVPLLALQEASSQAVECIFVDEGVRDLVAKVYQKGESGAMQAHIAVLRRRNGGGWAAGEIWWPRSSRRVSPQLTANARRCPSLSLTVAKGVR